MKVVFAGSFDPITIGHKHVIDTALQIFDEVVVAVLVNDSKMPLLNADDRAWLIRRLYAENKRVKVIYSYNALVNVLAAEGTHFYIRGIRNSSDCEYENTNFYVNKTLDKDLVEIYVPCPQEYLHISSSAVRTLLKFDKDYRQYIPEEIYETFTEMVRSKQ